MKRGGPIWLAMTQRDAQPAPLSAHRRCLARWWRAPPIRSSAYSPLLLAGTVLGMALVYLAPPLLLLAGGVPAWLGACGVGGDGARLCADAAVLRMLAAVGAAAAGGGRGLSRGDGAVGAAALSRPRRRVEGAGAVAEPALTSRRPRARAAATRISRSARGSSAAICARMSTPSTASRARPTTSPTIRRSRPTTRSAASTAWARCSTARPAMTRPPRLAMRAQPRRDRRHGAALPRRAARLPPRRDQAALSRLGRSDGVLPLFGLAGRAAAARPARRGARHLAAVGRAVQRAPGAEPSPGLRRRLPRTSTASTCRSKTSPRAARASTI